MRLHGYSALSNIQIKVPLAPLFLISIDVQVYDHQLLDQLQAHYQDELERDMEEGWTEDHLYDPSRALGGRSHAYLRSQ